MKIPYEQIEDDIREYRQLPMDIRDQMKRENKVDEMIEIAKHICAKTGMTMEQLIKMLK